MILMFAGGRNKSHVVLTVDRVNDSSVGGIGLAPFIFRYGKSCSFTLKLPVKNNLILEVKCLRCKPLAQGSVRLRV